MSMTTLVIVNVMLDLAIVAGLAATTRIPFRLRHPEPAEVAAEHRLWADEEERLAA